MTLEEQIIDELQQCHFMLTAEDASKIVAFWDDGKDNPQEDLAEIEEFLTRLAFDRAHGMDDAVAADDLWRRCAAGEVSCLAYRDAIGLGSYYAAAAFNLLERAGSDLRPQE